MNIVQLKTENIKRLSAVEITPDGSVVKISGKNASGKTSVQKVLQKVLQKQKIYLILITGFRKVK